MLIAFPELGCLAVTEMPVVIATSSIALQKAIVEDYEGKLDEVFEDYEEVKAASKKLGGEELFEEQEPAADTNDYSMKGILKKLIK